MLRHFLIISMLHNYFLINIDIIMLYYIINYYITIRYIIHEYPQRDRLRRGQPHQRRRLGEVVGCIVGNGNSRYTKSTVQLANFPGRRRRNVSSSSDIFKKTLVVSLLKRKSRTLNWSVHMLVTACVLSADGFVKEERRRSITISDAIIPIDIILSYYIYTFSNSCNITIRQGDYKENHIEGGGST